jgi:histidine triad (HIT) family protein
MQTTARLNNRVAYLEGNPIILEALYPAGGFMSDCVFCRIIAGELPASKVYEDAHTIAFMDLGQVNAGHVIVAVKPHVENIYGLSDDLAAAVFRTAAKVARAVKSSMKPEGTTLLQANEPAGWQTVFHFHLHVVPRHSNDGLTFSWPAKHPPQHELDRLAEQVRQGF